MYMNRSCGRLIEWLRNYSVRADEVTFGHAGGAIYYGKELIARTVYYDEYDTPTFDFVDDALMSIQARRAAEVLEREHCHLSYRLNDEQSFALFTVSKYDNGEITFENFTQAKLPKTICMLTTLGFLEKHETYLRFNDFGFPVFNFTFKLTPQAKGFLKYNEAEKSKQIA